MDTKAIQQLAEEKLSGYEQEHFALSRQHVLSAMVEMYEAGAAAASSQTGWVKASERKPKEEGLYFVRKSIYGGLGYTKYTARFEEEDFYDDHYNDRSLPFYVEGLEWLEEAPAPQAIPEKEEGEQEASPVEQILEYMFQNRYNETNPVLYAHVASFIKQDKS
jgi:hypothetical protein